MRLVKVAAILLSVLMLSSCFTYLNFPPSDYTGRVFLYFYVDFGEDKDWGIDRVVLRQVKPEVSKRIFVMTEAIRVERVVAGKKVYGDVVFIEYLPKNTELVISKFEASGLVNAFRLEDEPKLKTGSQEVVFAGGYSYRDKSGLFGPGKFSFERTQNVPSRKEMLRLIQKEVKDDQVLRKISEALKGA